MKQKTKTYVLLAVVLVIWGIVGYNIYSSVYGNTTNEVVDAGSPGTSFKKKKIKGNNDFSLHAHDRDPFLGTIKKKQLKPTVVKRPAVNSSAPETQVAYAGMVKTGASKGESIYFIRINGARHLMHIGDKVSKVKLIRGDETQITVLVGGKQRTVKK